MQYLIGRDPFRFQRLRSVRHVARVLVVEVIGNALADGVVFNPRYQPAAAVDGSRLGGVEIVRLKHLQLQRDK